MLERRVPQVTTSTLHDIVVPGSEPECHGLTEFEKKSKIENFEVLPIDVILHDSKRDMHATHHTGWGSHGNYNRPSSSPARDHDLDARDHESGV